MGSLLAESSFCRLCATEAEEGFTIFDDSEEKGALAILINKYLPIKVVDDGQLPVRICERCHIGVAATVDLIDRMVEGQQRLRALLQYFILQSKMTTDTLQAALINIQGKSPDIPMDDLAKGSEVYKVYGENHPMSIAVEGQPIIKKKRGRPKKGERPPKPAIEEDAATGTVKVESLPDEDPTKDVPRRSNRRSSLPTRYRDSIAGRDFEKLMNDSGLKEDLEELDDMEDAD
ncbi:uncharacterized protein, partial [Cherax quadricarinatus]|uniref:uncharacterized protein n=1 Tax=Cherax quadricarinatus TaxID=27406 RepID=UPI00387ED35B